MFVLIVFSAKISDKHKEKLHDDFPDQRFIFAQDREEVREHIGDADVLVTYGSEVDEELIGKALKLKWIMILAAGVERLPFELLDKKGIIVTNAKGVHRVQMAEYAISMLLQVYRQEKILFENEKRRVWDNSIKIKEITEKTIVIAGTGAIGQEVARLAKAFRMKTIGISRSGKEVEYFDENHTDEGLEKVLPEADFLVSVLPSTAETKGFFTYGHFEKMPAHGVFLNMGRGDAVSNDDILRAVQNKEIAHAVLDVAEDEPLSEDHPFWAEENITITPHISGLSPDYMKRAMRIFSGNLIKHLHGDDELNNRIDLTRGY